MAEAIQDFDLVEHVTADSNELNVAKNEQIVESNHRFLRIAGEVGLLALDTAAYIIHDIKNRFNGGKNG